MTGQTGGGVGLPTIYPFQRVSSILAVSDVAASAVARTLLTLNLTAGTWEVWAKAEGSTTGTNMNLTLLRGSDLTILDGSWFSGTGNLTLPLFGEVVVTTPDTVLLHYVASAAFRAYGQDISTDAAGGATRLWALRTA